MTEMIGNLKGTAQSAINTGWSLLDKVVSPEQRATLMTKANKFAQEQPKLASFLLSHIALSGLPIAIFIAFTVTVAVFALLVAIILALLGAVLFIVVMAGFALAVLFPVLLFTTFVAVSVWLWGWGAWYLLKWFNQKDIPGIHTGFAEGWKKEATDWWNKDSPPDVPGQDTIADGGKASGPPQQQQNSSGQAKGESRQNGHATGSEKPDSSSNDAKPTKRHPGHKVQEGTRGTPDGAPKLSEKHSSGADQAKEGASKVASNVSGSS